MKKHLGLLLIVSIGLCLEPWPSPVPIVNAELNQLLGEWYIGTVYIWGYDNKNPSGVECAFFNISIEQKTIITAESWKFNNETTNDTYQFEIGNSEGTVWKSSHFDWYILGVDPISQSWLVLGGQNQTAYILERNPNAVSNMTLSAIFYLLRGERYLINNTNYYTIPNDCPLVEGPIPLI
jgi:lipocalin